MSAARKMLDRLFPEQRELIVRARGSVRYVRLNRPLQIGAVVLTASAIVWTTVATVQFTAHNSIVSERDDVIAQLRDENARYTRELAEARERVEIQRRSLTSTQQTTVDMETANLALQRDIETLRAARDEQQERADTLALTYLSEVEAMARLSEEAEMLTRTRDELRRQVADRDRELAATRETRLALDAELADARSMLVALRADVVAMEEVRTELQAQLDASDARLRMTEDAKLALDGERRALGEQVADLSERLATLETAQLGIVSRLGETANQSGEALRKTLDLAGLDVDRLLDRMARAAGEGRGIGGPLLAIEDAPGAGLAQQIATVERRVDDLQSLQALMERLPLAAPLDEYRVTSNFGRRIDPFTRKLAFHSGTDMASRRRAPVRVTSPGVVTFVGWKGGFGKMVEVDHGLGVRTRYGHLSTVFVKRGQEVDFREKVGLVGSTGRSSGEHLHYEILIDGRHNDPANFIKAGQYVFKN